MKHITSAELKAHAQQRLAQVQIEKANQIAQTLSTHRLQCLYGVNGPRRMSNGVLAITRPQINAEIAAIKSAAPKRVWFSRGENYAPATR